MPAYPFAPRPNPDGSPGTETEEKFRERVNACLEVLDALNRKERAERHIWLGKHRASVGGPYWERSETSGVMREAVDSYIHGNFISTLVLALAYVEHVLNDRLPPVPLPSGKVKSKPTITDRIEQARAAGRFSEELLIGAEIMSDFRNPFIHRRNDEDPDTLGRRVWSRKEHPRAILEQDACDALQVMYGFFRHSFHPLIP
jgi:hypothetical protein